MTGFLMLTRSDETAELLRHANAFALLSVIAYRARRNNTFNVHGLKTGEALIGDCANYGMTPKAYRIAKAKLEEWGLAAFKGTNKGTIASLCNSKVYDINADAKGQQEGNPGASQGRAKGQQGGNPGASNNNNNNENNGKNATTQLQLSSLSPDSLGIDIGRLRVEIGQKTERLWTALLHGFPVRTERTTNTFRWAVNHMVIHALLGKPEAEQWLTDAIEWIQEARSNGTRNPAGRWISLVQQHTGLPKSQNRKQKNPHDKAQRKEQPGTVENPDSRAENEAE